MEELRFLEGISFYVSGKIYQLSLWDNFLLEIKMQILNERVVRNFTLTLYNRTDLGMSIILRPCIKLFNFINWITWLCFVTEGISRFKNISISELLNGNLQTCKTPRGSSIPFNILFIAKRAYMQPCIHRDNLHFCITNYPDYRGSQPLK